MLASVGEEAKQLVLRHCQWECNWCNYFENHFEYPLELDIVILDEPAMSLLCIYPSEMHVYVHQWA